MPALEANFDGIVGPTHNYAGLSPGNVASASNAGQTAHPKAAALQGLAKAKSLADLGLVQHVLPPLARPDVDALRAIGFTGDDAAVLQQAADETPDALAAACSASAMWAANAATVSPSADTEDGRLHLTTANLAFNRHRALEPAQMTAIMRTIFADERTFAVHDPLLPTPRYFDEGAANHTRLCAHHGERGIELFCYGRPAGSGSDLGTGLRTHPARQGYEASAAVARLHGLRNRAVFARQNPAAIDAGVFHNDVISVGNEDVLLVHEDAYDETDVVIQSLINAMPTGELHVFRVSSKMLTLQDAVSTYLFNSQLVTLPSEASSGAKGRMLLVAPSEVEQNPRAKACVDSLLAEIPAVDAVQYVDVRESMRNGGGPACLRLRVVMTEEERDALGARTALDDALYADLNSWVERHYRDELAPSDLADPALLTESRDALDELSKLLELGSVYPFQR